MNRHMFYWVFRIFIAVVVALLVVWLALDTSKRPEQLISFGGVCMFIVLVFLLSAHRAAVSVISHLWLSLVCFAETLDIIWPCASIILGFSRSASL